MGRIRCIFSHGRLGSAMVARAGSRPIVAGAREADRVLSLLEDFRLGRYVDDVRAQGRAALSPDVRTAAAALYRRVREARQLPNAAADAAGTLGFAEAVLRPQW